MNKIPFSPVVSAEKVVCVAVGMVRGICLNPEPQGTAIAGMITATENGRLFTTGADARSRTEAEQSDTAIFSYTENIYRRAVITVAVSVLDAGVTLTPAIRAATSSGGYSILAPAAIAALGSFQYRIGPEFPAAADTAQDFLPPYFTIEVTKGGAVGLATYAITLNLFT